MSRHYAKEQIHFASVAYNKSWDELFESRDKTLEEFKHCLGKYVDACIQIEMYMDTYVYGLDDELLAIMNKIGEQTDKSQRIDEEFIKEFIVTLNPIK